jgi:hypothetical protein
MSAALDIIAQRKQQVGPVAVTFTIGRIVAKPFASPHPAGDQCVDGGLFSKDVK